jgi:hypothetical protein
MSARPRQLTVPDPDGVGRLRAEFVALAPGEPATIEDPRVGGGTREVDQVWIKYLEGRREGTVDLVPRIYVEGL